MLHNVTPVLQWSERVLRQCFAKKYCQKLCREVFSKNLVKKGNQRVLRFERRGFLSHGGLFIIIIFFRGRFWIFFGAPGSMLSCSPIFCFSASLLTLLLCFSCFSAFLLFAFPASLLFLLLCFSAFCFSCFFAFLLLSFPCFYAFVILCLSTSTILLFLLFSHVFLLLYFLLLCFFASCLYCLFVFHFLLLYSVLFASQMKP